MATWQYRAYIVPRRFVADDPVAAVSAIQEGVATGWEGVPARDIVNRLMRMSLPAGESWTPDMKVWGDLSGHYVSISVQDDQIGELEVAIDAREFNELAAIDLASVMVDLGACLLDVDGIATDPVALKLAQRVVDSDAGRFVRDPVAYLDLMGKK